MITWGMEMSNCTSCRFSELLVNKGDSYSYLNPVGEEVIRIHEVPILQCRAMPPIAGTWPQVTAEDWCGQGEFYGHSGTTEATGS